jgi:hypothetical protein
MSFIGKQNSYYDSNPRTTLESRVAESGENAIKFTESYINDRLNKMRYIIEKIKSQDLDEHAFYKYLAKQKECKW